MFAYLWIVILIILAVALIGYTILAIEQAISEAENIPEAVEYFLEDHPLLTMIWLFALIAIIFMSIYEYATMKGTTQV